MAGNNKEEKTELECSPKTGLGICKCPVEEKKYEFSQSTTGSEFANVVQDLIDVETKDVEESDSDICIIEEVFGNAVTTSSGNDDITFYDDDVICLDPKESQLIVPKKTDDITKIKGWRRKQFFVEKPTTIEFQEFTYDNRICNKILTEENLSEADDASPDGQAENAFVCESLDEFLKQDADLKINYEIPHLFAEVGIKLTKEEIASAPRISEKDFKEVETKYCRSVPSQNYIVNLDEIKQEKLKRGKRPIEGDVEESFKIMKLENNRRLVRAVKKSSDRETNCNNKYIPNTEQESKESVSDEGKSDTKDLNRTGSLGKIKLTSKVLGVVVYPSPHKPLHPIVQFHLKKLRSYRTKIDAKWANFAASALVRKDGRYERCILPASCCVKVLTDPVSSEEEIRNVTPAVSAADAAKSVPSPVAEAKSIEKNEEDQSSFPQPSNTVPSVEELKRMKNCRVVIKRLDIGAGKKHLCTKHDRYKCKNCNLCIKARSILKPVLVKKTEENVNVEQSEPVKPVLVSSQPGFYEDIASLLAKKLKIFHPDSLTSIDSLKTLNFNTVELIKLRFIQKSFLHRYISIWYLKSEKADLRSRAFLTFSKKPPVPNAVNLRYGIVVNDLPKVIREIVYVEKSVDPNEYVLLHCNGNHWEIHGSVNVAFNKSLKSTEQVVIPANLRELKNLQDISFKMLKVKTVKWWILDLSQQFKIMELKSENFISTISQKKLLEFIKNHSSGFMPLRTNSGGRIFGAYMIQSLLPYVLIGPYYFFEICNMSLRGDFSTLPFEYTEMEDQRESNTLKFYISSTIKETKETGKAVEGLWLHYKSFADHLCFIEVLTAIDVNVSSRSNYSIHDEHGYSLNSTSLRSLNLESAESRHGNLQVEVYLYFDIFGLGYVLGVMEEDNSVTITHPLNERTKVNSTEIGNWFLGILRRKVQFVPNNLVVNWFVTKYKSHLRNRQPFNKNFLNGAHILTESGLFYVLKLTNTNNQSGILKTRSILEAAGKSSIIEEFVYLKILSDLLVRKKDTRPKVDTVLRLAVKEIRRLQNELNLLNRVKACLEEEKLKLFNSYLMTIHLKGLNLKLSVLLLKQIETIFFSKSGNICESYLKQLKSYSFGRKYLRAVEKREFVGFDEKTLSETPDSSKFVSSHTLSRPSKNIICVPTFQIVPNMPKTMESNSNFVEGSLL